MNLTRAGSLARRLRAVAAVAVTFALSMIIVPAASAASAPSSPPPSPSQPHLSTSSLTGLQWCDADTPGGRPLSRSHTPLVIASKELADRDRTGMRMLVQVAPPDGRPLLTGEAPYLDTGERRATYQVPEGALRDGEYRVRVRTVDARGKSDWVPWCAFTVYTGEVEKPAVPGALQVASGPYSPFQRCGDPANPPSFSVRQVGILASMSPRDNPNLVGRFEIGRGEEEPRVEPASLIGANIWPGTLPDGSYRFRVRAEDGITVSDWSSWCDFVILP
ncbi:hypothetical protein [Streptosporangium sandarakinum]|uniref:hypothetical protein n=1 Tax=Streptosporangium sandarakinum TaxID=1260955 RepID=UPI0034380676